MIKASSFRKAIEAEGSAKQQVASEMPNAAFVLSSIDNEFIYFNIIATLQETNDREIRNLKEKTRFALLAEDNGFGGCYQAKFKMAL